jgi:Family of unknown function (DUF6338)
MEAAELVVIGGTFSLIAIALGLVLIDQTGLVSLDDIGSEGSGYATQHPFRSLITLVLILGIAYALSYGSVWLLYRNRLATIDYGYSAWYWALERYDDYDVYVTADLKSGESVAGYVVYYTVAEVLHAERDLVLAERRSTQLKVRGAGSDEFHTPDDDFVVINGAEIMAVSGRYVLPAASTPISG